MAVVIYPTFTDSRWTMQVSVDRSIYRFNVNYNDRSDRWFYDIYDQDENPIVTGQTFVLFYPLNFGFIDERLPVGRFSVIDAKGEIVSEPVRDAWAEDGQNFRLVYITED